MASNRVIEQYKRERDKYQRKIRAMERQNPDYALRRENARRERARKTATTKYEVPNNLKPPESAGERFAKFVAHVLDLADPLYRQSVTKQMQDNYLSILQSAKDMYTEAYKKATLRNDDLKKIVDLLNTLIKYVSKLPPQEFYRKYLADSENRIDFEVIYIQDEWELEDIIQEFTEILETWRRL